MRVVNGYVCQTGCDEAVARRGIDPRNPHDDPVKEAQLAEKKSLATGENDAVQFGGALDSLNNRRPGDVAPIERLLDLVA